MKNLQSGYLALVLLAALNLSAAEASDDLREASDDLRLDNLGTVQDVMDESGDKSLDLANEPAPISSNLAKNHPETTVSTPKMEDMPELTVQDLASDIKMHRDISTKQFGLQRTLENLVRNLGGKLDYGPGQYATQMNNEDILSESERALIKKLKNILNLCRQAGEAHAKIALVYENFQALEKAEFEPGDQLETIAFELSKNATQASEKADQAMVNLGIKPIVKI